MRCPRRSVPGIARRATTGYRSRGSSFAWRSHAIAEGEACPAIARRATTGCCPTSVLRIPKTREMTLSPRLRRRPWRPEYDRNPTASDSDRTVAAALGAKRPRGPGGRLAADRARLCRALGVFCCRRRHLSAA